MLQGEFIVSEDLSKVETETELLVNNVKYVVERSFLLGLAVTSKGSIYPIGEENVLQGYIGQFVDNPEDEDKDEIVSVLPVNSGFELTVWTTKNGELDMGAVKAYEINGTIFNSETGTSYTNYEAMVEGTLD